MRGRRVGLGGKRKFIQNALNGPNNNNSNNNNNNREDLLPRDDN